MSGGKESSNVPSVAFEAQKREIYEKMNPRRRKFVDRIGYDNWDPFQEPKHPVEMRRERRGRTAHQLLREFQLSLGGRAVSEEFNRGALECAVGVVNNEERVAGCLAFCAWYDALLRKEGSDAGKI